MPLEDIVHEADYEQAPEQVWRAIATAEGLGAWLMANDFKEARVGAEFQFRDRPRPFWNGISDCKVIEADAPRRLALLWNFKQDKQPSTVTWTLTRTPSGGTHLAFRHSGLHGFMGLMMKRGMQNGWGKMVRSSIPYVAREMAAGRVPAREFVKARAKEAARAQSKAA
ncbi:MAG: SRPBCC family protein [Thermoplasmatota archaeon]